MPDAAGFHVESEKPEIQVVAGQVDRLATCAEHALAASGLPIFQRGAALVRPVSQEVPASRGRLTIAAGLRELTTAAMLDVMSQAAAWTRWDARSKKVLAADPPPMVAAVLLSRAGHWEHLPPVAGIITTPTLRPDGSILDAPGYDAATRLYHFHDPVLALPRIPPHPSPQHAADALGALAELLTGFPFVSDVDRSVALSAIITAVVRGALPVAPLHAFRASSAGTGKSYLADTASARCNEVPKAGGGAFWEGEDPAKDYRDFQIGHDSAARMKHEVVAEILSRLRDEWLVPELREFSPEDLATKALYEGERPTLKGTRVDGLLEFGRIVHAEMSAITEASRLGRSVWHGCYTARPSRATCALDI